MIEYILGCATVGVAWYVWPKIPAWLSGKEAKIETQAKAAMSAVAGTANAEAGTAKAEIDKLKETL
jgi:hypothetical protein